MSTAHAHAALALLAALAYARALPLEPRRDAIINVAPSGNVTVFNPDTQALIPQAPASDGGGTGLDVPAIIWIAFAFTVGAPLALAGIRGGRFTTASALGLAGALCGWAGLVNTISAAGLSDLELTLIVFGFFVAGFILGLFANFRIAALVVFSILGGLSIGIRAAIMRAGLLFPSYIATWVLIAAFGAAGGISMIWKHRISILMATASTGTFLCALGVDLFVNKQSGMSRGLRFLFDRNTSHLADIFEIGYHPQINTIIIIGASIGATPVLAVLQHKVFPKPFWKPGRDVDENELPDIVEGKALGPGTGQLSILMGRTSAVFGNIFTTAPSRFSLG